MCPWMYLFIFLITKLFIMYNEYLLWIYIYKYGKVYSLKNICHQFGKEDNVSIK